MLSVETATAGTSFRLADLDREAEWERVAQLLDLDPVVVRRLRMPRIECVSHYAFALDVASLHLCASESGWGRRIATVMIGAAISASDIAQEARELQIEAALADTEGTTAATGLQLPSLPVNEQELWQIANECAPLVARLLGNTYFVPRDLPSAAFATWISHAAAQYGVSLSLPATTPLRCSSRLQHLIAQSLVESMALGMEEQGKTLSGATAIVVGGCASAASLLALHEAGVKLVGIADESGAIVDSAGLTVSELLRHREAGGLLAEFPQSEHLLHSEVIAVPADILLLETDDPEITVSNALQVKAGVVVEGSQNSLAVDAANALSDRGVLVIPRRLSHCVQVLPQALSGVRLRSLLQPIWEEIALLRKRHKLPLHTASFLLALQRCAERERVQHP